MRKKCVNQSLPLGLCPVERLVRALDDDIEIGLRQVESDLYRLSVKDNGRGLDASMARVEQLGLEIVEALAEQLDGSMSARNAEGTVVDVLFRMQRIP